MTDRIHHRDGWIIVSHRKPVSRLMVTREEARREASRMREHSVGRFTVYPARVITVWKPEHRPRGADGRVKSEHRQAFPTHSQPTATIQTP